MKAGSLNARITVEVKSDSLDSYGASVETWAPDTSIGDGGDLMASFEPVGSREFPESWKRNDETTARFRIRYEPGIDAARHRISMVFDEYSSPTGVTVWDIFPPLAAAGRRRELIIEAKESR